MAKPSFLVLLALLDAFVILAMARAEEMAPSPSMMNQKLGLHGLREHEVPLWAPSMAPRAEAPDQESMSSEAASNEQEEEEFHLKKHHKSSLDKSVAGGGVILGGLATAFMVAVFCYVRATRRRKQNPAESASPV